MQPGLRTQTSKTSQKCFAAFHSFTFSWVFLSDVIPFQQSAVLVLFYSAFSGVSFWKVLFIFMFLFQMLSDFSSSSVLEQEFPVLHPVAETHVGTTKQ